MIPSLRWLARRPEGPGAVSGGNDKTAFVMVPGERDRGEGIEGGGGVGGGRDE